MIIRIPHRQRFTIIADEALRDARLSFRATGILAYLLSLPDGTEITGRRLTDAKSEGRDAVFTAMTELEQAGYLIRERSQRPDGTWTTAVTLVETPSPGNPDSVPRNRHITSHQPSPGNPTFGEPGSKSFSTSSEDLKAAGFQESVRMPATLDADTRKRGAEFFRALRKGETA